MYCTLKYIDYLHHKNYQHESVTTLKSFDFSDVDPLNDTLYFNPNCILQLILDYICVEAHLNTETDYYDLCSMSGDLLNIRDYSATTSGLEIFQAGETYFVVLVKRNETTDAIEEITPMLNPQSELRTTLLKTIRHKQMKKLSKAKSATSKQSLTTSHTSNTSNGSKLKRKSAIN